MKDQQCRYCHFHSPCTVEPVYKSHPWDTTKWLLYRGGLLIKIVNNNGKITINCIVLHKSNQQSENKYNSTKCNPKSINCHVCAHVPCHVHVRARS